VSLQHPPSSLLSKCPPMEHRLSFGSSLVGQQPLRCFEDLRADKPAEVRGSAVNYPGNSRFRPRCAFKVAATSQEMELSRQYLSGHAIVITDDGSLAVQSREEVKYIVQLHFGIRKHEFLIVHSRPEPLTTLFYDTHFRDVLFTAGRVVDGSIELGFHSWDLDRFGERDILPYHVKLCLEGVSHYAWNLTTVEKILCDEASILQVEEDT
jgi:hypothetical protein